MKKIVTIVFCFGIIFQTFAQTAEQPEKLFSEVMRTHFKDYAKKANFAYKIKDYTTAESLFTKFIDSNLVSTKFKNFKAKKLNGSIINIETYFKKPVVLITYASWCVRSDAEKATINDLAKEFHDDIDFVILFWDDQNTARKSAKVYNKHINVLYINERENIFNKEVSSLKQTLGFPLTLYIDVENKIVDISKKTPKYQIANSNGITSNSFKNGMNALLISVNYSKTAIAKQ